MNNQTPFQDYLSSRGNAAALAAHLGVTRGAISQWNEVPISRVGKVSEFTGIPRHALRPDVFEAAA